MAMIFEWLKSCEPQPFENESHRLTNSPTGEALNSLTQFFECPVCRRALENPTQTQCGHMFCSGCVGSHTKSNKVSVCPLCKTKISNKALTVREDIRIMKELVCKLGRVFEEEFNAFMTSEPKEKETSQRHQYSVDAGDKELFGEESDEWMNALSIPAAKSKETVTKLECAKRLDLDEDEIPLIAKILPVHETPVFRPPESGLNKGQTQNAKLHARNNMPMIQEWLKNCEPQQIEDDGGLTNIPTENVLRSLTQFFECPICCCTVENPTQTQCGHVFCTDCLGSLVKNSTVPVCPLCKIKINNRALTVREDIGVMKELVCKLNRVFEKEFNSVMASKEQATSFVESKVKEQTTSSLASKAKEQVTSSLASKAKGQATSFMESEGQPRSFMTSKAKEQVTSSMASKAKEQTTSFMEFKEPAISQMHQNEALTGAGEDAGDKDLFGEESDEWMNALSTPGPSAKSKYIVTNMDYAEPANEEEIATNRWIFPVQENPIFCPSRLKKGQIAKLHALSVMCRGTVVKNTTGDFTHLVITLDNGRVPQTFKYLLAIARRRWVVTFDWVEKCIEKNERIPEEPFETSNFEKCDRGPRLSRIAKTNLFQGFNFFFASESYKNLGLTFAEVEMLMDALGAYVVPSLTDFEGSVIIIGIVGGNKVDYNYWLCTRRWITVTFEWFIDCILEYKLLPFAKGYFCLDVDLTQEAIRSLNAPKQLKACLLNL